MSKEPITVEEFENLPESEKRKYVCVCEDCETYHCPVCHSVLRLKSHLYIKDLYVCDHCYLEFPIPSKKREDIVYEGNAYVR